MITQHCRILLFSAVVLAAIPASFAQAVTPAASTDPKSEEALVLSPFEVGAGSDRGYQPTAILQGGRGRIDLADVAGQVAVFSKEFMEDIGATTMDQTLLFSATTQTYFDNVNGNGDNRPGSRNVATDDSSNSRGLGVIDRTRNFFRTTMDPDSYNLERLSLISGANAVQFGLGGAAGTLEATTARANLTQNRQKVQVRTDSYGSERFVVDVSQVLVKDKLAIRAIGLRENMEYFLQPGAEENRRAFGTVTYKPFKRTTIRLEGEYHYRLDNRPPTVVTRDRGYMSFLANPIVYNNVAATSTAPRPAVPSYTTPDGTRVNYALSTKTALYTWPQNVPPQVAGLRDVRNTVFISLGDTAAGAATSQSLVTPGYPWDVNQYGGSRLNRRRTRNITGTIEQQLGRNTYLELGYAWEFYRNHTAQILASNGIDVMVDVNRFLPDGLTPNPMYGRAFVEGNNASGQGQWADNTFKYYRATLTHEVDFTRNSGWRQFLGRHKLALFGSHDDTSEYFLGNNRFLIIGNPSFLSAAAQANPLHADRAFYLRYYLPPIGSSSDPHAYAVPNIAQFGDIMGIMNFTTPSGEPFQVTQYMNPAGFVGTTPRASHLQRISGAASTSSTFFKDSLVVNLGVRHDRVRNSDFAAFVPLRAQNPPTPAAPNGSGIMAFDDFRTKVPADRWTPYRDATRVNYGFVLRPARIGRWVSFGYDYSRNASLNEVAIVRDVNGDEVEPAYGESHEYNVRFRLFDDRLSFKINYFNALQRHTTLADSSLRANLIDFEQQLFANDPRYAINPLFRPELNPVPGQFRLPGDRNSRGIEFDVTFNPTRNWRIFANAGRTKTEIDDISTQPWWNYLEAKLPAWQAIGGNWATARYDNNLTVQAAYNSLIAGPVDSIRESLGNPGGNSQTWRSNLVATRLFTEGRLKGASASVNFRYRGPRIIGFPSQTDARGRVHVLRENPYKSDDSIVTGLMANYRFRSYGHTSWRVQLNANNVFNSERFFVTRVFDNGIPRNYGRQPGREFVLSATMEH